MSRPVASQHEFFQSIAAGKTHTAMHCKKTGATQYYLKDGTPKFFCCSVEETFIPENKNWFQRTFGKPELETRKFLLTPKPRSPVQWIEDRDCTAIYEPTLMEGPAFE